MEAHFHKFCPEQYMGVSLSFSIIKSKKLSGHSLVINRRTAYDFYLNIAVLSELAVQVNRVYSRNFPKWGIV